MVGTALSSIIRLELSKPDEPRLLEVDNRCVLPGLTSIRFCITSTDVIHSWALSRMAIKLDAIRRCACRRTVH
ncbi:cytochrome c oxidase subunit 2 [Parelaphostrongylus tenuis]|uniref:cytochrome-c oxidase n=1 Tax=Parelaphostrongylus tenuis TaxID=148309 RepID=A0AAD5QHU0_PARTN|nr:cytochrome c oxidase subunit 2 [Parelaphostrongylus tenuis]